MKKLFLILFATVLTFAPLLATAQATNACTVSSSNPATASTLPQCINQVYEWSLGIGALLALLMVVVGGYYIMTSSGNAEQASRGKEIISGAVIGLIILFCAYLILYTINPDLVNFSSFSTDVNGLNSPSASGSGSATTSTGVRQ